MDKARKLGMNPGCINCPDCPVKGCDAMLYRGSRCMALRRKHGLGDPLTKAEKIQAIPLSELRNIPRIPERRNTDMKKTVVFDFDGVIHSYTSGWKGITNIPDPPVAGIKKAITEIRATGYEVVVVSTRCASLDGLYAVEDYLRLHEIEVDAVQAEKPPATVYIDDRAICFDGNPSTLLGKIQTFKPWHL